MDVLVTGATGFIGRHLVPRLSQAGHRTIPLSRADYDLLEQSEVRRLFSDHAPDAVIHLAGKVGGILANKTYPADFMFHNLAVNTYFLEEAKKSGIKRLVYTFCGCSYPSLAPNPIKEDSLFTGLPDGNSMFYSLSKAANHLQLAAYRKQFGLDWVSVVPGNAYGPHDNFSEKNSHVIPALIRRFHFARERGDKTITVWGTGSPVRDFVYVEDVADAMVKALDRHHEELPVNISSGTGVKISELVEMVRRTVGFEGEVIYDKTKPDGHMVKVFDTTRMRSVLDFEPKTSLEQGLALTYSWFKKNIDVARL